MKRVVQMTDWLRKYIHHVIPTAQIYPEATRLEEKRWQYKIEASFAEICNKTYKYLRDTTQPRYDGFPSLAQRARFWREGNLVVKALGALQLRYSTLKNRNSTLQPAITSRLLRAGSLRTSPYH
jgi:hypothetical protein